MKFFKIVLSIEIWDSFIKKKLKEDDVIRGSEKIGERDFEFEDFYYFFYLIEYLFYYKLLDVFKKKLKWEDIEKDNDWSYLVS